MKMEKFRKGREEVEKIIGGMEEEIKVKFVLEPEKKIGQAQELVDELAKEATGEIQERSVSNMNMNINTLKGKIDKLPAKKKPVKKRAKKK
ncbi:MAG: hypothetical protein KKB30_13260 [Proteobacteria bacterium]|nr:hypothetical protein [Pseudomonadota bacterium]MBU1714987.1 hypothetical protein [Pseudomonadota bacterium]